MKKYRELIWGTGVWCRKFLEYLPEACLVEAFVETKPSRQTFKGLSLIGLDDFKRYYEKVDFVFVAVCDFRSIEESIRSQLGHLKNVFFCKSVQPPFMITKDGRGWYGSLEMLFDETFVNCRLSSFTAPYVVCEVEGLNFLVNSTYKMFVNALAQNALHQGDDIRLFLDLTKEYYGIEHEGKEGIFFDIGGNIGTTSIYVKKVLNPRLKVISFEPDEENCRQFKCSCILNGIDKNEIRLVQAALSDEDGEASIMLSDMEDNMGDHRVLKNGNMLENRKMEQVKKIRLDTWLDANDVNPSRIKYVWMDVQAHEGFVLKGGQMCSESTKSLYLWSFGRRN